MHSITVRQEKDGKVYHDISLTRGDSLPLQLVIKKNDETYTPDPEDEVRFAMKAKYTDEEPTLVKTVPVDTLLLEIEPDDTKELPMKKTYVYDIQLTDKYGYVDTFIEGKFTIDEEVM